MTSPTGPRANGYGAAAAPAVGDPLQAALSLRSQGRLEEALELLSGPGEFSADVYTLRGDILAELERWTDAAGSYYSATMKAPQNLYVRSHLGACLHRLKRWDEAAEAFQLVLKGDPHRDAIRLLLADCLLHLNRLEQALDCFDQCWSDAAQRPALFGKGVALQLLRRFEEAEAAYERVLVVDGKSEESLANLIAMSMEVFDLDRVLRYSRRLVAINPGSVQGLQGLTLVAIERGEMAIAAQHFSKLVELAPDLLRPSREASDDVIEYRVSSTVIERLKGFMQVQPAPAARRY